MSNPFANWSQADVEAWNAGLIARRGNGDDIPSEGVEREADLHDEIENELKRRGWYYVHSRMDRATTQQKGVVDFIVAAPGGITYWIECKGAKTKVTPEQAGAIKWLGNLGHQSYIVRSLGELLKVIQ